MTEPRFDVTRPPTLAEEEARVARAAQEYGFAELVEVPFGDETPELVRPAVRLFATLTNRLAAFRVDAMPVLADARYSATLAALERSSKAVADAIRVASLRDPLTFRAIEIRPELVELDALYRVEDALASILAEIEAQARRAQLLATPEEHANVSKILRGQAAQGRNGHGRP